MRRIPLFPLPGVVFFPGTLLPLHIFEPRYRTMVEHALDGERTIGMALIAPEAGDGLPPGAEPRVLPVGGAGLIVEHERLADGRFNIVLEGAFRYRLVREEPSRPYRTATVEELSALPFPSPGEEARAVSEVTSIFRTLRAPMSLPPLPDEPLAAERLSGELALRLRWPAPALQRILEIDSLPERFSAIRSQLCEWRDTAEFLRPFRPESVNALVN